MTDFASLTLEQLRRFAADPRNVAVRGRMERRIAEMEASEGEGHRNPETSGRGPRPDSDEPGSAETDTVVRQVGQRPRPPGVANWRKQVKQAPRTDGLGSLSFTLVGAPRTKKNSASRLMHNGRPSVVPSRAWMKWRDHLRNSGQVQPWMRVRDQRMNCAALFFRDRDIGDATGYYQGLADVLQELGVVSNDRWLVTWNGSELLVDRDAPRVEIRLTRVDDTGETP